MKKLFVHLRERLSGPKLKHHMKAFLQFVANPRLLLCFAVAWLITNGWSYVMFTVGTALDIEWMTAVAGAYLAFLWLPVSPEKLLTFAITLALLRWLFPHDVKTLAVVKGWYDRAKAAIRSHRERRLAQKNAADSHDSSADG